MNDQKKPGSKLLKGCLITAAVLLSMGALTIGGCAILFSKAASVAAEEQSQIRILNIVRCNQQLMFYEFENAGKKKISAFQGQLRHVDDFGKQDIKISLMANATAMKNNEILPGEHFCLAKIEFDTVPPETYFGKDRKAFLAGLGIKETDLPLPDPGKMKSWKFIADDVVISTP